MTAIFTVQLHCANRQSCNGAFPQEPATATATELRERAADSGWEVMRGKHGRELCPDCRIAEIRSAAGGRDSVKALSAVADDNPASSAR